MNETRVVLTPDDQVDQGALKARFSRLRQGPVVIDLAELSFINSAILGSIAELRRRLPDERIVLAGLDPSMVRLIHIVGFNTLFEIGDLRAARLEPRAHTARRAMRTA